jgi:transcriptional regulator with XRE-family HTH domain
MSSKDSGLHVLVCSDNAAVDLDAVRAKLRAERLTRDWTLDDMAARAGVNRSAVHDIETNREGKPQFQTIAKLVEGLGLTLSAFFLQIEGSTSGARETTLPSLKVEPRVADDSPPLSSSEFRTAELALFSALSTTLVESLTSAVDRAADRIIEAVRPDRPAGSEAPSVRASRRHRDRQVG